MTRPWLRRLGFAVGAILLGAVSWLHCAGRINLVTADLGRHLSNGRLFLSDGRILSTNYYSFTWSDFPAVCHHWGFGVLAAAVWKAGGFSGLSLAYTSLLLATFLLALWTARRVASTGAVVLAGLLALPLIGSRIEIRPEGISTLFLMLEYFLFQEWRAGRLDRRWLWSIVVIQLAWVNLHILFFTGLLLGVIYLIAATAAERKRLLPVMAGALLVSLLNPFTLKGLTEPLTIFQGYGYDLAENQSVFFMMKRFPGTPLYGYFLFIFLTGCLLLVGWMVRERSWRKALPQVLAWALFGLMALKAVRAAAMAGFVFIPVAAESLAVLAAGAWLFRRVVTAGALVLLVLAALVPAVIWSPMKKFAPLIAEERNRQSLFYVLARPALWSGLMPGVERSAAFFHSSGLKGPVFNNYDMGGYFIYYLFPRERPFVDNRPEGYPVDFLRNTYITMQSEEPAWQAAQKKYAFEVIYFYRQDITPWAQPFLLRRLDDQAWAPVFVDDYMIIMARRGGVNAGVIGRYELPRAMFRSVTH
ncbi:MAG: hypothetical protein WCO69_05875 [Candidatus Omnitrophota bacterium]